MKKFSKLKGIEFNLLSDPDGSVISALGMRNEQARKLLPHPGTLVIGGDGVVYAKLFNEGHKQRHDNAAILAMVEKHAEKLRPTADAK